MRRFTPRFQGGIEPRIGPAARPDAESGAVGGEDPGYGGEAACPTGGYSPATATPGGGWTSKTPVTVH